MNDTRSNPLPEQSMVMRTDAKIYVAGHRGMVGSAILRKLQAAGYTNVVTRSHAELDLTDGSKVRAFFEAEHPDHVFLAAARVGGILANDTAPGDFIYENLAIETNVLEAARCVGVKRLLFLGSSCIYPRDCPQPIREEYLLTGPLEETNRAYAIAKIAGVEMCRAYNLQYGTRFLAAMPCNLYGPGDNYDLESSHVLPALIRKMHEARTSGATAVTVWGTGRPRREFLHADDLAEAVLHLMNAADVVLDDLFPRGEAPLINIGAGSDVTVADLARLVARIVGFDGELRFDSSRPDGTPRKLLDTQRIGALLWTPKIDLAEGIARAYADYTARHTHATSDASIEHGR